MASVLGSSHSSPSLSGLSSASTHASTRAALGLNGYPIIPDPLYTCSETLQLEGGPLVNSFGFPYRQIGDSAFPAFFLPSAVDKVKDEWTARSSDVFFVGASTNESLKTSLKKLTCALVEQLDDVDKVDTDWSRWVDAAVSRRGWGYIEALDEWPTRRCLETSCPPKNFPCRNSGIGDLVDACMAPRIAVFLSDPRWMLMTELECAGNKCLQNGYDVDPTFLTYLETAIDAESAKGLIFDGVRNSMAWAEAELRSPDRIRIFYVEDFMLQPEIAMRGLAKFLDVSSVSDATEKVVRQAETLCSKIKPFQERVAGDMNMYRSAEGYVVDFERQMAAAPSWMQSGWEQLLERWLQSPSPRMVAYAIDALAHQIYTSGAEWWPSHNARVCRPCLFFPRGTCKELDCSYCHGPGHAKHTKRPTRKQRDDRKKRYDRTPSPDIMRECIRDGAIKGY